MNPSDVVHILEATTGGTRRHLVDLVLNLDRRAYHPSVVCSTLRDPGFADDVRLLEREGVPVTVLPMVRAISPLRDRRALAALTRHLRRARPAVVHTHSSKAGFLGRLAARKAGVPVVIHTPHVFAFQMDAAPPLRWLYLCLERMAAQWCSRIICVCEAELRAALTRRVAPESRFVVIHNGIETRTEGRDSRDAWRAGLDIEAGCLAVGTIGRLTHQKDHRTLLEAARLLAPRFPQARFIVLGEGELLGQLTALARRCGLSKVARIQAFPPDISPRHPGFDVFVSSSLWEGMPYTILDAMACGSAIVATRVGGVPEALKDCVSGLLVPPRQPAALADAVSALLANPERRSALGERARETIDRRFRLDRMTAAVERVYAECMSQAGFMPAGRKT